jgi:hypothetical protein
MKKIIYLVCLLLFLSACSGHKQFYVSKILNHQSVQLEDGTVVTLIGVNAPTKNYLDELKKLENNYIQLYDENYDPINEIAKPAINAYIYNLDGDCINDYVETDEKITVKQEHNKLQNGDSPFDSCFGKGEYNGESWILFKNGNETDAIVCLVELSTGRTIRNDYICAGSEFTMNEIPSGTYYLKVYYGNDWNTDKDNICGKGAFNYDEHFSKSINPDDYIEIENSASGYSTFTITLYSVINGNMSSEPMSETDFFNN